MGVIKAWSWRYSGGVLVWANHSLDLVKNQKEKQQHFCWRWPAPSPSPAPAPARKPISWSVVCGIMLFTLGLISLLTGHVASDFEHLSHKIVKRSLYYNKLVRYILYLSSSEFCNCIVSVGFGRVGTLAANRVGKMFWKFWSLSQISLISSFSLWFRLNYSWLLQIRQSLPLSEFFSL